MARKVRILLSPGYHAEAGETKGHQHDVYTTVGELHGYQRIHVGTLMKSAVNAWANAFNGAYLDSEAAKVEMNVLWRQISDLLPQTKAMLGRWCRCGDNDDGSEHWYWQQCSGRFFDHLGERHWCLDGYRFEGGPFYGEAPTHFIEIPSAPERSSVQPQPTGTRPTGSTSAPHPVGTNR